jgi:hypothetical protein
VRVTAFNIDQSTQHVCDQFEISVADSEPFRTQARGDLIQLRQGLLDAGGDPSLMQHITEGIIDEFELHVDPDKVTGVVRGRDAGGLAVDTSLYITYGIVGRTPPAANPAALFPGNSVLRSVFPPMAGTPGVVTPLVLIGQWTARSICHDLVRRIGMNLVYEAPDYLLREEFVVSSPVISAIQTLVSPFSQFEPSKVDVFAEGKTLVVRSRRVPVSPAPLANVFSVHDARITKLMVRTRFLDYVRVVRLFGIGFGGRLMNRLGVFEQVSEEDETFVDETTLEGGVTTRVVEVRTTRRPDGAVVRSMKETYVGDVLTELAEMHADWEAYQFDGNGAITNSPQMKSRTTTTRKLDAASDGLVDATRVTEGFTNDEVGFLNGQSTLEETFDSDQGIYVGSKLETKSYRTNGTKQYETVTTTFTPTGEGGFTPGSTNKTQGSGFRPGGPGRSPAVRPGGSAPSTPAPLEQLVVEVVDATQPGAKDITVQDANLTVRELRVILAQARFASGATEYEINFTASGIPWVRRGQSIRITGLLAEDGVTPIVLDDALVFEVHTEYREDSEQPTYLTGVKAVYWKKP